MMKPYFVAITLLLGLQTIAQENKTEVLSLGTFHFNFPNNDFVQIADSDKIDVLAPNYQKEITGIVGSLERFDPTIIVIERPIAKQEETDSLYKEYLVGNYELGRGEWQQFGYRLAKALGIKTLYCVDVWGAFNQQVERALFGKDTVTGRRFKEYYRSNPDSLLKYQPQKIVRSEGIRAALLQLNDPENLKKSLGNYLVGPFKFESTAGDFFGVHFETGRWFNRNLKIFRNIQRIKAGSEDRILVIYGAGHMNLLNLLFESSPEFKLVRPYAYLH